METQVHAELARVAQACDASHVPSITGRVEVNLSGRDPRVSAEWYGRLLGLRQTYDFTSEDGEMRYVCLVEPDSGLVLCLVGHRSNPGDGFSELHTGLDHLEFLVERMEDLERWAQQLDALGIANSGVKRLDYTQNAMVTFRDPDNIQLEFFWRAPRPSEAAPLSI